LAKTSAAFRDGQALAGALAGELKSHATAIPILQYSLREMVDALRSPEGRISMQEFEPPNSPVFDAGVPKLGLLGPTLAEEVAFVYEQIRAFRITYSRVSKRHADMPRIQTAATLEFCLMLIDTASTRGTKLILDLQRYATEGYWSSRPWMGRFRSLG
jgi:hypothetical protein